MNSVTSRDAYRPDIDGLRSIAVVSVVLFHAQLSCPGGFVGVDVFFVISGYLITKIIERDLEQHCFSIMKFYQRRIRRIFPALFAMFFVCTCIGLYVLPPMELLDLGKSLLAAAAFCSNFLFYRQSGYFDSTSTIKPLLHTWTLSVEEQFYIFWPLLLWTLRSRFAARWRLTAILSLLFGSLLLSVHWVNQQPNAAFYLLPSRAWELALGAVLSIAPVPALLARLPRRVADGASLLGLGMLMTSIVTYDAVLPFPGFAALLPCLGAALILAAGEGGSSLGGRLLSIRPLVWTGLISYSLYLWHWPMLVFARIFVNRELHTGESIGLLVLMFVLAWLSWRFVESPFRNARVMGGSSRTWVISGLTASFLFIAIGAVLFHSGGLPQRSPEVVHWVADQEKDEYSVLINSPCMVSGASLPPTDACLLGAASPTQGYKGVLWGDSHAAHLAVAVDEVGRHMGFTIRELTKSNCPPVPGIRLFPVRSGDGDCPIFNNNALQTILSNQQVRVVIIAARWTPLAEGTKAVSMDGRRLSVVDSRRLFIARLQQTIETLIGSGRQVILIGQVPGGSLSPITCVARARFNHWSETTCLSTAASLAAGTEGSVNEALNAAAAGHRFVQIVHPFDILCGSEQTCKKIEAGRTLYWDASHLSSDGARLMEGDIEKAIASSLRTQAPSE